MKSASPVHALGSAEERIELEMARAEFAVGAANRATADLWRSLVLVLDEARTNPRVFVDPALPMPAAQRVEFSVRAAVADLAVRLGFSEPMVRNDAFDAQTLRSRLPQVWARFSSGEVCPANARAAADLVRSLPDDLEVSRAFDDALVDIVHQAPGRFRVRARVLRERLHAVPSIERARAAALTRDVWITNDLDGMADLGIRLPAVDAHRAFARITAAAQSLVSLPGETRTLAQARADAAADILVGTGPSGATSASVAVAITVPVMTALGLSDEPGSLDGYGPIDADTARRLAAHAPSFTRLLTHPVSSAILDLDRTVYRPPADLKRWLEVTDQTCRFPGCGRLARNSDLDHTIDFQFGGPTNASNLAHLCRHHHRLKHQTRWQTTHDPDEPGRLTWVSPTGHPRAADPPPF